MANQGEVVAISGDFIPSIIVFEEITLKWFAHKRVAEKCYS